MRAGFGPALVRMGHASLGRHETRQDNHEVQRNTPQSLRPGGMRVTQPFDASTLLSIDPELCRRVDFAQGHELVEWQMGVFRQPL